MEDLPIIFDIIDSFSDEQIQKIRTCVQVRGTEDAIALMHTFGAEILNKWSILDSRRETILNDLDRYNRRAFKLAKDNPKEYIKFLMHSSIKDIFSKISRPKPLH